MNDDFKQELLGLIDKIESIIGMDVATFKSLCGAEATKGRDSLGIRKRYIPGQFPIVTKGLVKSMPRRDLYGRRINRDF